MLDRDIAPERIRPLRRIDFDRLVDAGSFEGERVELLYGSVVEMSPHGPAHDATIDRLLDALRDRLAGKARIRVQSAFAASDGSEPQPDVAVVPLKDYDDAHPSQAFLIVEVAESSLAKDLGVKTKVYAECGVVQYVVVDLVNRRVEVFADPGASGYASRTTLDRSATIDLAAFEGVTLPVASFLK